jgi:arylsulfatase A-like enzyme/tetratricopeptide (TPR) repeat protein
MKDETMSKHRMSSWMDVLLSVLALVAVFPRPMAGADTNMLLVTIDTLRPDRLSCYSTKYLQTAQIDRLAASGALFERAFAHTPLTLPSHTNILLGLTPPAHGVSENSKSVVAHEFLTLAEHLKAQGYATGAFVSSFSLDSRFGLNQGFDVYNDAYPSRAAPGLPYSERPAEKTLTAALAWLSEQRGKWFCWVHLWDPHAPYSPPEPYASRFKADLYSGEVAYVDAELERLFQWVDKNGGLEKTLIVLAGDHGESIGEHGELFHGYFAYNATLWVPLIIAGPGIKTTRVKDYVSHIDIFPTVCEILGVKAPQGLQGMSLVSLIKGRGGKSQPIYFECLEAYLNRGWAPLRGLIRDGKKFIDSPIPEYYDLEKDFEETSNLAVGIDLRPYKKSLEAMIKAYGAATPASLSGTADRETRERLRSLGYIASPVASVKASYGPEDDLKTLLPYEQKLKLATQWKNQGRTAESVKLLEEIIKARPDFVPAYFRLAEVYESKGLVEDRLQVLDRGFSANPKNYVMIAGYGVSLVNSGRLEKGIEILSRAIALSDKDAEVWNSLGMALWKTGEFDKARAHFEQALALDPDDAIFNDNMGSFFVATALRIRSTKDVEKALGYFEKAIAADPLLPSAYNGLAGAQKILGRTDEAIRNWEKAHELSPEFDFPVYNLAVAYLEKGETAQALEYCRKYLDVKGKNITAEERRDIQSIMEKCRK